jgi:hypothetical protein
MKIVFFSRQQAQVGCMEILAKAVTNSEIGIAMVYSYGYGYGLRLGLSVGL